MPDKKVNRATAHDVARWMAEQFEEPDSFLHQADAANEIAEKFGDRFVYENDNGNLAIDRDVLREFRKLTETTVVWVRSERLWERRQKGDPAGRQVD